MAYSNYLIESDALSFPAIQEAINRLLLDGLDVRLTPVSRNQALIRRHILDAISAQYGIDPFLYLQSNGLRFDKAAAITDDDALALLAHRAASELDARPDLVVAPVGGVQWHLANINVPHAWALMGGPDRIAWACKVGQIDTGYLRHPALGYVGGASSWLLEAECRNFYSPNSNSSNEPGGPSGEDPRSGPNWGHGMRIGATISGWHPGGDTGSTFYGCAPRVPHVMVRISNSVIFSDQLAAFADALDYLVDRAGVDVVNVSMATFPPYLSPRARRAVNNAFEKGVILVCAGGQCVTRVLAPASYGRTIAVGGTTSKDQVWANASLGPQIDWSAPAAEIRRATIESESGPFVYRDYGDGTSYATALSTGVAALWLTHQQAQIARHYGKTWMRVCAFKQIAKATARRPGVWGPDVAGTGILDALALLTAPLPDAGALVKEGPV
ncbi:MAG: hypothetical protein B7X59_10020 [Polaromonas sp. 39-63-203]|jgi:hypothetical protein|uniref:S8 family peptidase n=1 Tax=Polaromonas sp. TaxID=1869339 RepID=UPI000BC677B8|nr:S8/S53 family peptidase [Polaromonas sp.]OYY51520.1 MAG: hypothetical protein B7Y54_10090 [Polaromonas sp. 35-63-240]OYZ82835.1 MAG: hypothetical protein B7Y03_10565 [Polaromonas sp. 24-62-144]OZA96321.1 MAG: hypothetical protein B7X59_10020 [Polaromonas sp. 39-63-203]HQS33660.1 S8/S53 family peptidase [Polaromonas sp.]HQS92889.1 S8/S53 family peptidase [Polaromonas sp.]